jgi:hypothetical protein
MNRKTFLRRLGLGLLAAPFAAVAAAKGIEAIPKIEDEHYPRGTITANIDGRPCWYDGVTWRWSDSDQPFEPPVLRYGPEGGLFSDIDSPHA